MELYLPYVKEILTGSDGDHCMQASWHLFAPLSQILGVTQTQKHLSPQILALFNRGMWSHSVEVCGHIWYRFVVTFGKGLWSY